MPSPNAGGGSVGHYLIGKTVGEGTFGKVKLGTHILTGEHVAIKVLEKSRIKEDADVRRIAREINILKKVRHRNVIQLFEVIDTKDKIYLIMEYSDGGELFDYIVKHRRVPEPEACDFFHQILDGIDYIHSLGVTHRDLKPENLLMQRYKDRWRVKVIDFGLSNMCDPGKLLKTACGSPCYAPPEMIAGESYVGSAADIWSLGVILFALVCGYLPFEDKNTSQLYKKILSGKYRKPHHTVSPLARDLIKRILDTNPKRRFTTRDIRRHPWFTQITPDIPSPLKPLPRSQSELHPEAVRMATDLGVDKDQLIASITRNAHNHATTTYFLLADRLEREGSAENNSADKPFSSTMPAFQSAAMKAASAESGKPQIPQGNGFSAAQALAERGNSQPPAASKYSPRVGSARVHGSKRPNVPPLPFEKRAFNQRGVEGWIDGDGDSESDSRATPTSAGQNKVIYSNAQAQEAWAGKAGGVAMVIKESRRSPRGSRENVPLSARQAREQRGRSAGPTNGPVSARGTSPRWQRPLASKAPGSRASSRQSPRPSSRSISPRAGGRPPSSASNRMPGIEGDAGTYYAVLDEYMQKKVALNNRPGSQSGSTHGSKAETDVPAFNDRSHRRPRVRGVRGGPVSYSKAIALSRKVYGTSRSVSPRPGRVKPSEEIIGVRVSPRTAQNDGHSPRTAGPPPHAFLQPSREEETPSVQGVPMAPRSPTRAEGAGVYSGRRGRVVSRHGQPAHISTSPRPTSGDNTPETQSENRAGHEGFSGSTGGTHSASSKDHIPSAGSGSGSHHVLKNGARPSSKKQPTREPMLSGTTLMKATVSGKTGQPLNLGCHHCSLLFLLAQAVVRELLRVLRSNDHVKFSHGSTYAFDCALPDVDFVLEVKKLKSQSGDRPPAHVVRARLVSGDVDKYKDISRNLLSSLRLEPDPESLALLQARTRNH